MSTSTASAKKHLNKAEFELYTASLPKKVATLTPYRLKQKISRLEKLRSKHATIKRAQKRTLKSDGLDASAQSNRKIKLSFIDQMLKSYKAALKKRVALEKEEAKKKVTKKKVTKK